MMHLYPNHIQSLLYIAAEIVALTEDYPLELLEQLPSTLKEKVLLIKSKRGMLNDAGMVVLVDRSTKILDLSECDISDTGLSAVRICSDLRKIDLNSTQTRNNVSDAGVGNLKHCPLLHIVYLKRCVNITDVCIVSIAQNCRNLMELDLFGCKNITDRSLLALETHCPHLNCLNAAHTAVTDDGVCHLAMGALAPTLKELDFSGCNIGDDSVEALITYCNKLRILIIQMVKLSASVQQSLNDFAKSNYMQQLSWTIY